MLLERLLQEVDDAKLMKNTANVEKNQTDAKLRKAEDDLKVARASIRAMRKVCAHWLKKKNNPNISNPKPSQVETEHEALTNTAVVCAACFSIHNLSLVVNIKLHI